MVDKWPLSVTISWLPAIFDLLLPNRPVADQARQQEHCETDADLQPWDKRGEVKQPLAAQYDAAHMWVYGDFDFPRSGTS